MYRYADPYPDLPPPPRLTLPVTTVAGTAVAAAVAVLTTVWALQRLVDRLPPAHLLRT